MTNSPIRRIIFLLFSILSVVLLGILLFHTVGRSSYHIGRCGLCKIALYGLLPCVLIYWVAFLYHKTGANVKNWVMTGSWETQTQSTETTQESQREITRKDKPLEIKQAEWTYSISKTGRYVLYYAAKIVLLLGLAITVAFICSLFIKPSEAGKIGAIVAVGTIFADRARKGPNRLRTYFGIPQKNEESQSKDV